MALDLLQTEFYFPRNSKDIKSKEELVDLIVENMKENNSINYSGYADEGLLKRGIMDNIGKGDFSSYEVFSEDQKKQIEKVIEETIIKCNDILKIPTKNFIFVLPWFPTEENKMFNGVTGVAVYSCVFYIYVFPKLWSAKVLSNSVAHELNHTIFYYNHYDNFNNYTLLDELVMEGLAENFRESVIDPEHSPWSSVLSEEESFIFLDSIKDEIDSKDRDIIDGILFGNDKYKRWSGYSVGYWLVKRFIKQNKDLTWDEIMKKDSIYIFNSVIK